MIPDVLQTNAAVILLMMLVVWCISIPLQNVSIVDLVWGLGFVLVAWTTRAVEFFLIHFVTYVPGHQPAMRDGPSHWLLPLMVTIWGLRLSLYLAWRNHGKPEDKRYAAMRNSRGPGFWWQSLFIVFLLQGAVMWVVSLPVQLGIATAESGWTYLQLLGILIWGVGLYFETVGDWQLAEFRNHPANQGKVLDQGLWRYTRHPNYFGDFCVWWGLYIVAIAHGENLWTIISPLIMSFFLMKVSGVTLLEKTLTAEKPEYQDYIRRTNAFFPWFPKSS